MQVGQGGPRLFRGFMARNRIIKPDFWADEKIGRLSPMARLLFLGTLNFSDDVGVCRGTAGFLRSQIFQFDEVSLKQVDLMIQELVKNSLILTTKINGESFIFIRNFFKHQKIDRPSPFRFISETTKHNVLELFNSSSDVAVTRYTLDVQYKENENENVNMSQSDQDFFEQAWELYPIKKGKSDAKKHFKASVKTESDFENFKKALDNYKKEITDKRTSKEFIKHGKTFFKDWKDYLTDDQSPLDQEREQLIKQIGELQ